MKRTQRSGTGTRAARAEKPGKEGPPAAIKRAGKAAESRAGGKGEKKAPARGRTTTKSPARGKADGSTVRSKARGDAGGGSRSAGRDRKGAGRGKRSGRAERASKSGGEDGAQASADELDDDSSHAAFPRGTYLAFLDPSAEGQGGYRLGLVLAAVGEEDNEISCDVFALSEEPLHFKRMAR